MSMPSSTQKMVSPGLPLAVDHRPVDGRGAPVFGEDGGVVADGPQFGDGQDLAGHNVGDEGQDRQVGLEGNHLVMGLGVLHAGRLINREARGQGRVLEGVEFTAPVRGAKDAHDLLPLLD